MREIKLDIREDATPLDASYGPPPRARPPGVDVTDWQRAPLFGGARHFRALHRLYGVADGLTVAYDGAKATVAAGVAFDAYDRPLWLLKDAATDVNVGQWIVLVGQEPDVQQLDVPVPAPQECKIERRIATNGNAPEIQPWEVPLARVTSAGGLDLDVRPIAVRAPCTSRPASCKAARRD